MSDQVKIVNQTICLFVFIDHMLKNICGRVLEESQFIRLNMNDFIFVFIYPRSYFSFDLGFFGFVRI